MIAGAYATNIATAPADITTAANHPMERSQSGFTRFPITLGSLVKSTMSTIRGGAKSPFATADQKSILTASTRALNALGEQVIAHLVGVIGIDGNVVELPLAAVLFIKDFDVLAIVDLDECDADAGATAFGRKVERLGKAEKALLEPPRLSQILHINGHFPSRKR